MAYDRQPLAFLVDLCSYYTAFKVETVKTVNYIFGLIAPRSNAWDSVFLPRSYILLLKTKSEIIWTTHW